MTSVIGITSGGTNGAGVFAITPTAGAAGYLAIVAVGVNSTLQSTFTPPSGFTLYSSGQTDNYSDWYVYTGGPTVGTDWTLGSALTPWAASVIIMAFDTAVTIGGFGSSDVGSNSLISPSITPSESSLIIRAETGNPWPSAPVIGYPSGTTNQASRFDPESGEDHSAVSVAVSGTMSGATGTASWSSSGHETRTSHTIAVVQVAAPNPTDLSGTVPTVSTVSGALVVPVSGLSGRVATVSAASGAVAVKGPLSGRVVSTSVVSGALSGGASAFLRTVDASGRFFRDQQGRPYIVKGDSPWSAFTDLSVAQFTAWCQDRKAKGFNAGYISAIGDSTNGAPNADGSTFDGILPFVGGDITVPNEPYWARVDQFFNIAEDNGITIFLYLIDGWNVASGGGHLVAGKSVADCYTYGRFIGTRYGGQSNVVWMVGGDYKPTTNSPWEGAFTDHQFDAALRGARDTEAIRHLQSIQLNYNRSWSTQNPYWRRRVDFQHVYTYQPTYEAVWQAYFNTPAERVAPDDTRAPNGSDPLRPNIPALFMEGHYEFGTHNISPNPVDMRRQVGWGVTAGSPGEFYGNDDWQFKSGWEGRMSTDGVLDVSAMRAYIETLAWSKLIPNRSFITSGAGAPFVSSDGNQKALTDDTYATAAVAADGSLALVFVPTQRQIVVDASLLGANPTGEWYNADTGAKSTANLSNLTPPTAGDWLLTLRATPAVQYLSGSVASVSAVTGQAAKASSAQGSVSTVSQVSGSLTFATGLSGTVTTVSSVHGDLTTRFAVSGTVTTVSTVSGRFGTGGVPLWLGDYPVTVRIGDHPVTLA